MIKRCYKLNSDFFVRDFKINQGTFTRFHRRIDFAKVFNWGRSDFSSKYVWFTQNEKFKLIILANKQINGKAPNIFLKM